MNSARIATRHKILITVEGNIGSGKSTAVRLIENEFKDYKNIAFLQEPVEQWLEIKDKDGETVLQKYYSDMNKYSFAFQMMAYISRLSILRKTLQTDGIDIIISERSVYTDRHVFAQMLYDSNLLNDIEFKIYLKWFDEFLNEIQDCHIFYVRTDPEVAYERVLKRSREGETMTLDYLHKCHDYHEAWIQNLHKTSSTGHSNNTDKQNNPYNKNSIGEFNITTVDGNVGLSAEHSVFNVLKSYIQRLLRKCQNHICNETKITINHSNAEEVSVKANPDNEYEDVDEGDEQETERRIILTNFHKGYSNETQDNNSYVLEFDGGSRGNPGEAGCGFLLYSISEDGDKTTIADGYEYLKEQTNNTAEYMGLCLGLEAAELYKIKRLDVKGDSALVINQMNEIWKINKPTIRVLYEKVKRLEKHFEHISYNHIPRHQNRHADHMANLAMNTKPRKAVVNSYHSGDA